MSDLINEWKYAYNSPHCDVTIVLAHHRHLLLPAPVVVEVRALECLVQPFAKKSPDLVDGAELLQLSWDMCCEMMIRNHRFDTVQLGA